MFPSQVKIVEVSPRDGLQNETKIVPTAIKIKLINQLSETGLSTIEVTSFVSPKWIPQLADAGEVFSRINKKSDVSYPVLVPNKRGLENALLAGVKEVAVFTTPSEEFSQRNTNCTVAESLQRIAEVVELAKAKNIKVRAYLSCVLGCPYEGDMAAEKVVNIASELYAMGCYEISLGDTIGVGTPLSTKRLLSLILPEIPSEHLAVHFHDTYGVALANIYAALQEGIHIIDSSVAGLGGCPYAKGASGNVATEDVVYFVSRMGIETGVDLDKLIAVGNYISNELGRKSLSKVSAALRGLAQ